MNNLSASLKILLMLYLSIGISAFVVAQDRVLTSEDVASMQSVTDVKISADGLHVAYTVSVPADPMRHNHSSEAHLYLYDRSSGEHRAYYTRGDAGDVQFRPGHGSVTFLARGEGDQVNALYEMPVDGGGPVVLFRFQSSIRDYSWSSDGKQLAFTAAEPGAGKDGAGMPASPEFYEEGLVDRKGYVVDFTHRKPSARSLKVEGTIYTLRWSPDDARLAVAVAPTPLVDDYYMRQDVQVVRADDGQVLVDDIEHEGKLDDIRWSPGGDKLALLAGNDIHDVIAGRIMVVEAAGGKPENIYPGFEGRFEQIAWTSDNTIHFIASESTASGFGTIRPDGSGFGYKLEPGGPVYESFSVADNGHVAFEAHTPHHPGEVYHFDGEGSPARITHVNPWLKDIRKGEQTVVGYEARDGLELEGMLIRPVGYEPGQAVPLIVKVHGGPEAHYSNGWLTSYSSPGQVAAGKGYAVFYPNYRGSTGRGIDFLKSSQGDAGGREFDDIVDGVDHLIDQGIADPDRVGVTGGSYGGYATGWMATYYSDRFAAGVMNFGISNNISSWGTSDIPQELYLVHSREWFWEDNNWQKYLERSPIYHVDKAQTPLLITHGKADTRVYPGQSLELYRHMKVRKPEVPLRLVMYPGEGHGYRGATHRYDYNLRMMRWFDAYLKGGGDMPPLSLQEYLPE